MADGLIVCNVYVYMHTHIHTYECLCKLTGIDLFLRYVCVTIDVRHVVSIGPLCSSVRYMVPVTHSIRLYADG